MSDDDVLKMPVLLMDLFFSGQEIITILQYFWHHGME